MPRSALIADVCELATLIGKGDLEHVEDIRYDSETDEVHLSFRYGEQSTVIHIDILCGDLDQYPISRHYFISTTDLSQTHTWAASKVNKRLQAQKKSHTLREVVDQVTSTVERLLKQLDSYDSDADEATFDVEVQDDPDSFAASVIGTKRRRPSHTDDADDGFFGYPMLARLGAHPYPLSSGPRPARSSRPIFKTDSSERARKARISQDLRAVYEAGYFFGILDDITPDADDVIISVSVKISTLKLPYQMLLAWSLNPNMYYVLLMHFSKGYFAYEPVDFSNIEVGLTFRIGECTHYKPTKQQAYAAFGIDYAPPPSDTAAGSSEKIPIFKKILISSALGKTMSDSFLTILRIREKTGGTWAEALKAVADPHVLYRDTQKTLASPPSGRVKSLPLLAMEFAVERLRNYTKYCQSCFGELDKNWQSLKPTTCSQELCLYQHIQIGLTQYLEFEIICQPAVIDLLINFCYVALTPCFKTLVTNPTKAASQATLAIRDFPAGLRLLVPDLEKPHKGFASQLGTTRLSVVLANSSFSGIANPIQIFSKGQWVAIGAATKPTALALWYAEISEVDYINSTLYLKGCRSVLAIPDQCQVYTCTKNIQEVDDFSKCHFLRDILNTVPPVAEMKKLLEDPSVGSLKCIRGVSPSAVALLEWILATNRSCIVQITDKNLMIQETNGKISAPPDEWLQFCFLHGPPHIEAEFEKIVNENMLDGHFANPAYPTLLAWHGSHIQNWHSILRTGLDYNMTLNGRSFGDGVYFSNHFRTSSGYSTSNSISQWPNATMDLQSMVSLNEVINRPSKFRSCTPHYVVQPRNWSRCRFLFARTRLIRTALDASSTYPASIAPLPGAYFTEDPLRPVYGPYGGRMILPRATMLPRSHTEDVSFGQGVGCAQGSVKMDAADMAYLQPEIQRRQRITTVKCTEQTNDFDQPSDGDSDVVITKVVKIAPSTYIEISDDDDDENDEDDYRTIKGKSPPKKQKTAESNEPTHVHVNANVTPFMPGTLDHGTLHVLAPPSWGTASAQRALAASMHELQKVQASTPLPNLGWYIDFDKLDNLFQWVVELHSFDNDIPLAADMRARGVNSIIMEMRFGPDFPMTPPLVRVVRPRFLPFSQGGGGHITTGGSVCMELLTTTGWLPNCELASVLMQVHLALSTAQPPARLLMQGSLLGQDYEIIEAIGGYLRAAATHGWSVPTDMFRRAS